MKGLKSVAMWLVIIGGLNWGLIGIFQWDLVAKLLGSGDMYATLPRVIYTLVGLSALWSAFAMFGGGNKE